MFSAKFITRLGALVGGDIYGTENWKKFGRVLKPTKVNTNSSNETFSSTKKSQTIYSLLKKFSECYTLISRNSPICKHEVKYLGLRCASLGCYFPTNFCDSNLTRKLHQLSHHMYIKARQIHTVGMESEQCIESIHPLCNKLNCMYCTVTNKSANLVLIAKQQWLQSATTNLREPTKRVCPKCHQQSHYGKNCSAKP